MFDSGFDDSLGNPLLPKPTNNKETGNRPNTFIRTVIVYEATIGRSWSNRTPSDGVFINVPKQADGNTGGNAFGHRRFAAGAVCTLCFLRSSTPHHTPTRLGTTPAFKKLLEVRPPGLIHFVEYHPIEFG